MIRFKEYLSEKPLTPQQRIQRGRIMKRLQPKIAMKRKIAMKKKATPEKLKTRAMKKARDIVRAKFIKGKSYKILFDRSRMDWSCSCPAFTFRRKFKTSKCKHIIQIQNERFEKLTKRNK